MKVTIENKKGLGKDIKVIVDKKTMDSYLEERYEEVRKNYTLKGFRPGKAPREVLKRQFGEAIMGEVLDKVLKDTSTKALEENKIRPATQPKIDLKKYGEGKELEYVMSVTELPEVNTKQLQNIKFDEYKVKIDKKHTEERINQIAKSQNNFKDADANHKSVNGDLVVFDYKATSGGKDFKGNEGKNTQLIIGKDLFIKGFDDQLIGVKKNQTKKVEVKLPENFPEKDIANKNAIFECNITNVKINHKVKLDDEFAKNLGAKDLNGLKELISKQINDEYKNSLDLMSKSQILDQLNKFKIDAIPSELIDQEIHVLSHGMKEEDVKKNKKDLEGQAKKRIKTGLILNEFGQQNKIKVTEQELNTEIQKQFQMMPGQEKMVKEYYEKNPSAIASLRGSIYEEKILAEIKKQAKATVKEITKEEAEKILKEENKKAMEQSPDKKVEIKDTKSSTKPKKTTPTKKTTSNKTKKVSKK
jgi:trigger factor|tara:strand:- start:4564 stop:5982 length:1419 start_codon:yes stop_codon:yes gene_type:complete